MNVTRSVPLSEIRIDGGTQPREAINQEAVDEYAEAMSRLASFPAVVVFHDGVHTWLADGFHRYHAAVKIGAQALEADWRVGTLEQAKLFAASANKDHGLRRNDDDKRRAIEMVLSTAEGRTWKQKRIAEHCGVTQQYVSKIMEYNSCNAPKNAPPPAPTATEQKRTRIAAAAAADPEASDRAIARKLGVNRRTVASEREGAKGRAQSNASVAAGGSLPEPSGSGYSTTEADKAARSALAAMRAARAVMTNSDWKALLCEIGAIK